MAGPPPRIPNNTRLAIVEAVRNGERKASVARRFQVSDTSVTNVARSAGLVDAPLTEARKVALRGTIEANSLRAKYKRSRQALALMADTERLRRQLWQPCTVYGFGRTQAGEPIYVEHEIGEPDAKSKQALAITIGVLTDKALQLLRYDRDDDGTSTVKASILSLVDRLAEEEQRATPA